MSNADIQKLVLIFHTRNLFEMVSMLEEHKFQFDTRENVAELQWKWWQEIFGFQATPSQAIEKIKELFLED